MNVGSVMSSLTTSLAGGPPAPFASTAMVSGSFAVFTVAMVSLRFFSNSPWLHATGPSSGLRHTAMSVRSCLCLGTGTIRSSCPGLAGDRCVGSRHAVVIPCGQIVSSAHLDRSGSLLFECGERALQEFERTTQLGQLLWHGLRELSRKLLGQSPLDEHARSQSGFC